MPAKPAQHRELKPIGYELFIGALSVLSIANLLFMLIFKDDSLDTVVAIISTVMFPIFLADFLYRFFTAEDRSRYSSGALAGPTCSPACPSPSSRSCASSGSGG